MLLQGKANAMTNQEIGKRIKEARKSKSMTLEDVAKEIGVARSTVQRYEAGKIDKIKLPVVSAIADAIGVNDAWIIGKSDKIVLTDADKFARTAKAFNEAHPYFPYPNEDMHLTSNEKVLINKYRTLNDEGQNKLMERVDELIELVKYSKSTEREKMA